MRLLPLPPQLFPVADPGEAYLVKGSGPHAPSTAVVRGAGYYSTAAVVLSLGDHPPCRVGTVGRILATQYPGDCTSPEELLQHAPRTRPTTNHKMCVAAERFHHQPRRGSSTAAAAVTFAGVLRTAVL